MSQISDNIRCMASLAVFRELYNSNKSDIFSVIAAFAENIIIREKKYHFELQEFCLMLNNEYGFTLVTSIVKTALKKISFLTSIKTQYTVDTAKLQKDNKFEHDFRACQETNTKILDDFISFVAEIIKRPMSDDETQSLKEDFCAYTLDHKVCNPENLGYISAYILNHRDSQEFQSQLTRIREGMIIYNGLSYTLSPNEVEKYDADLNIFLETEVLFNMAGYNGVLCQHLFDEFYEQVFEINKSALLRNGKKVIHLKFFEESFNEINKFFKQAEDIISGNSQLVDPRNAMVCILNGCSKKYEIKEKQTAFEKMLREKDIILDDRKYNIDEDFIKSNLASIDNMDEINVNREDKDYAIQMMLSKINYLRQIKSTNSRNFKQVGYILLSGNTRTLSLGKQQVLSNNDIVPLSEPISFFTQRFWLSLNKGLLNGKLPITANIFILSQITFSTTFNKALRVQFASIKEEIDSGKLTLDDAKDKIAGLRVNYMKPEDINKNIVESNEYLDIFNIKSIERIQAERALEINELKGFLSQESSGRQISERRLQNIIDNKNAELQQRYEQEINTYNHNEKEWIKKRMSRKLYCSIGNVLISLFVIGILLYVIIKYQSLWAIITEAVTVILFVLGFIVDKLKCHIQSSVKYLLNRKERQEYRQELESQYKKENIIPLKRIVRAEDFD